MRPTARALILSAAGLLLAVLPTLVAPSLGLLWLAYGGLLLAAGAVDAVRCPRSRELVAEVELPERFFLGDTADAVVRLPPAPGLALERALAAEVTLDVDPLLESVVRRRFELSGRPVEIRLTLAARRRGPGAVEALWLRVEGPLGLVQRTVRQPLGHVVRVVPNVRFVRDVALPFLHDRGAPIGLKIEHYVGDGSEFESLREFRTGHDPRSIDWKASARHTHLLSREFRAERNHQVVLGLDTGRLMAEPLAGMPLLDHAIHAALLLAFVSLRHGDRVSFFPFAAQPGTLTAPRAGMSTLKTLIQLAGELEYSTEETNFTLSLTNLAARLRRRSLVVVFTDFVDSVTAELMVENLQRLRRRHLVLFVALQDPTLSELLDTEPRRLVDLDRAVVAASLVRERELTLGRLRKAGVLALDTTPARVGPRLVRRYLEIKRREMI